MNENAAKIKTFVGQTFNKIEKESGPSGYLFSPNGAKVYISYWRYLSPSGAKFSSFDDNQKYGAEAPIDSLNQLKKVVLNIGIISVKLTDSVSDIEIKFADNAVLQIFNFTGNEVWEMTFADGTSILSNYC